MPLCDSHFRPASPWKVLNYTLYSVSIGSKYIIEEGGVTSSLFFSVNVIMCNNVPEIPACIIFGYLYPPVPLDIRFTRDCCVHYFWLPESPVPLDIRITRDCCVHYFWLPVSLRPIRYKNVPEIVLCIIFG